MLLISRLAAYTLICLLVNYAAQIAQSSAGLIFFWPGNALGAMLAMHWRDRSKQGHNRRMALFMLLFLCGHYTASLMVQQHLTPLQQFYACLADTLCIPLYAVFTRLVISQRHRYRPYLRSALLIGPISLTAIVQGIIAGVYLTRLVPLGEPEFVAIDWASEQILSGIIVAMLLSGLLTHKRGRQSRPPGLPMLLLIGALLCIQALMAVSNWLNLVTIMVLPGLIVLVRLSFAWTIIITACFMLFAAASRIHFYLVINDYRQGNASFHEIFSNRFDFAMTAVLIIVMAEMVNRNRRLLAHIKARANTDPLTQLSNRRSLLQAVSRHTRGRSLGIVILDVDNFKKINDRYGHDVGDRVLTQISDVLQNSVRPQDMPARWGGEEFVVIFPDIPLAAFPDTCQRIIASIRECPLENKDSQIAFTASLGGVFIPQFEAGHFEQAIVLADRLLYQAKQTGKDKAIVATDFTPDLVQHAESTSNQSVSTLQ